MGSRSGGGIDRSVLEPERRRVVGGLDEDGPEYLHVLARARLDVLVQDVDPSLLLLRGMRADPELLERRHERLQPPHDIDLPFSLPFSTSMSITIYTSPCTGRQLAAELK